MKIFGVEHCLIFVNLRGQRAIPTHVSLQVHVLSNEVGWIESMYK